MLERKGTLETCMYVHLKEELGHDSILNRIMANLMKTEVFYYCKVKCKTCAAAFFRYF